MPPSIPISARSSPRPGTARSTRVCSGGAASTSSSWSTRKAGSCALPVAEIEQEHRTGASLMPAGLQKILTPGQFADLIAYLESLKAADGGSQSAGMPADIPAIAKPIRLVPMSGLRFDHPVWIVAVPGSRGAYLVVEQKSRKIWRLEGGVKELFVDLSQGGVDRRFRGRGLRRLPPAIPREPQVLRELSRAQPGSFFSPVIVRAGRRLPTCGETREPHPGACCRSTRTPTSTGAG